MNQGFASKLNMGGSEKVFGNMKAPAPKSLPKEDGLKVFGMEGKVAGPMQHKPMKPTGPRYKN